MLIARKGDFVDNTSNTADPYIQLLPLTNASAIFNLMLLRH